MAEWHRLKGSYETKNDAISRAAHYRKVYRRKVRIVKQGREGNGMRPWHIEMEAE